MQVFVDLRRGNSAVEIWQWDSKLGTLNLFAVTVAGNLILPLHVKNIKLTCAFTNLWFTKKQIHDWFLQLIAVLRQSLGCVSHNSQIPPEPTHNRYTATNSDNCQSSQKEMVGELNCHRNLLGNVNTTGSFRKNGKSKTVLCGVNFTKSWFSQLSLVEN